MYWRMLSLNPKKTQETVLCTKPKIEEEKIITDPNFIQKMIHTIPCVTSILGRAPEEMFPYEAIVDRRYFL